MELLLAEHAGIQKIDVGFSTTTLRRTTAAISSNNTIISPQNLNLKILPLLHEILPHVRNHTRVLLALLLTNLLMTTIEYVDGVGRRSWRNRQNRAIVEKQVVMRLAIASHGRENAEPNDAVRPLEMRRQEAGVGSFFGVGEREEGEVYR